jgi:hypothetical protein
MVATWVANAYNFQWLKKMNKNWILSYEWNKCSIYETLFFKCLKFCRFKRRFLLKWDLKKDNLAPVRVFFICSPANVAIFQKSEEQTLCCQVISAALGGNEAAGYRAVIETVTKNKASCLRGHHTSQTAFHFDFCLVFILTLFIPGISEFYIC